MKILGMIAIVAMLASVVYGVGSSIRIIIGDQVQIRDGVGGEAVTLIAPSSLTGYTLIAPPTIGTALQCIKNSATPGTLEFGDCVATSGSGGTIGDATGGTSGSILYVDGSGDLAQDNSNLFYDASSKEIGIGFGGPSSKVHAHEASAGAIAGFRITNTDTGVSTADGLSIEMDVNEVAQIRNYEQTDMWFLTDNQLRLALDEINFRAVFGGVTDPVNNLEIHEPEGTGSASILHFTNTATGRASSDGLEIGLQSDETAVIEMNENADLYIRTNGTDRLTIENDGIMDEHNNPTASFRGSTVTGIGGNHTAGSNIDNTSSAYIASCFTSETSADKCIAFVTCDAFGGCAVNNMLTCTNVSISLSVAAFRCTNTSGAARTVNFSATRLY